MQIFLLKRTRKEAFGGEVRGETESMVIVHVDEPNARHLASIEKFPGLHGNGFGEEGGDIWKDTSKVSCSLLGVASEEIEDPYIFCTSHYSN